MEIWGFRIHDISFTFVQQSIFMSIKFGFAVLSEVKCFTESNHSFFKCQQPRQMQPKPVSGKVTGNCCYQQQQTVNCR